MTAHIESRSLRNLVDNSLSFIRPALEPGWSVLDIGCGGGHVPAELARTGHPVLGLDIVDARECALEPFQLWDGGAVPCADGSFDAVTISFVLHHLPNGDKARLVAEARRVARRRLIVLEDTPRTPIDSLAAWIHGHQFRRKIKSTAGFGFYRQRQWERFFTEQGLRVVRSERIPRLSRNWWRPWARSAFTLDR